MDFLHFSSNVGSLGDCENLIELSDENRITRKNLYNRLDYIYNAYGKYPDVVGLQETGTSRFALAPRFGLPLITDDNVFVDLTNGPHVRNARRGVATYCDSTAASWVTPRDDRSEIVTTLHDYVRTTGRGRKKRKICCINVYKLGSGDQPSSLDEIKNYIKEQMKAVRKMNIDHFIVHGDFNDTRFSLHDFGLKELHHPRLAHKHQRNTAAKNIDKIFTNCEDLRIIEVLDTCEFHRDNEDGELGHKGILLGIGEPRVPEEGVKRFSMKKLRKMQRTSS